jgi:hypothetical protein
VDPKNRLFRYEPIDIHCGTHPEGKFRDSKGKVDDTPKAYSYEDRFKHAKNGPKPLYEPSLSQRILWAIIGSKGGAGDFDLRTSSPAERLEADKSCFVTKAFHKTVVFKCATRKHCKDWVGILQEWQELFLLEAPDWKGEAEVGAGTVYIER